MAFVSIDIILLLSSSSRLRVHPHCYTFTLWPPLHFHFAVYALRPRRSSLLSSFAISFPSVLGIVIQTRKQTHLFSLLLPFCPYYYHQLSNFLLLLSPPRHAISFISSLPTVLPPIPSIAHKFYRQYTFNYVICILYLYSTKHRANHNQPGINNINLCSVPHQAYHIHSVRILVLYVHIHSSW